MSQALAMGKTRNLPTGPSPFEVVGARLPIGKFADADWTMTGQPRAVVAMHGLATLWCNTGTKCNLACANCYIESSPTNDALLYLSAAEVTRYLDEISALALGTHEIGFTGGEPFMNPDIIAMVTDALRRGHRVLVLTNAMAPMRRHREALIALRRDYGAQLTLRVSLDHFTQTVHEAERGANSWATAIQGLQWLSANGFAMAVAGRHLAGEGDRQARAGYANLFAAENIAVDADNPQQLILFPEMDAHADVAEITTACWGILAVDPDDMMCATSRMVVHRKGQARARVAACTLIPYDPGFDMGEKLGGALGPVALNHPHCARFCVLGGASCSG